MFGSFWTVGFALKSAAGTKAENGLLGEKETLNGNCPRFSFLVTWSRSGRGSRLFESFVWHFQRQTTVFQAKAKMFFPIQRLVTPSMLLTQINISRSWKKIHTLKDERLLFCPPGDLQTWFSCCRVHHQRSVPFFIRCPSSSRPVMCIVDFFAPLVFYTKMMSPCRRVHMRGSLH